MVFITLCSFQIFRQCRLMMWKISSLCRRSRRRSLRSCLRRRPRRFFPISRMFCSQEGTGAPNVHGVLRKAPQLSDDVPQDHHGPQQHGVLERQLHRRDMSQDGPDQPVRHQRHTHHQDGPRLVPGALPHFCGGPPALLGRRRAADQPVRQHEQDPRQHHPAEPAPQGRQHAHHSGNARLDGSHSHFVSLFAPFSHGGLILPPRVFDLFLVGQGPQLLQLRRLPPYDPLQCPRSPGTGPPRSQPAAWASSHCHSPVESGGHTHGAMSALHR